MSVNERIKDIKNIFNVFDNPMDKYTQLIEIGKNCEGLLDKDKNDLNKIYGCASQAWVKTIKQNNHFIIKTDSDTLIVKGLLNILSTILSKSTKEEILVIEIQDILKNIGLENSITSQRTYGFLNALKKIKESLDINVK